LKSNSYLRYGDDFLLFCDDRERLEDMRVLAARFLESSLRLTLHAKNDIIRRNRHGLDFLGCRIYPSGRVLNKRNLARLCERLDASNASSYFGLLEAHGNRKLARKFGAAVTRLLDRSDGA